MFHRFPSFLDVSPVVRGTNAGQTLGGSRTGADLIGGDPGGGTLRSTARLMDGSRSRFGRRWHGYRLLGSSPTAHHFRAVVRTTLTSSARIPSFTNDCHPATTSRSNAARPTSSICATAAASAVLWTYCQQNSPGSGAASGSAFD